MVGFLLVLLLLPPTHGEPTTRSSSREDRRRVPTFSVVYFSRGTLPVKGHLAGGPRQQKTTHPCPFAKPDSSSARPLRSPSASDVAHGLTSFRHKTQRLILVLPSMSILSRDPSF